MTASLDVTSAAADDPRLPRATVEKQLEPLVSGWFWSIASSARGFAMPAGDTPHCHRTVTGPPRSG